MRHSRIMFMGWLLVVMALAAPQVTAQGNPRITVFGGGSFLSASRSFTVNGQNFDTRFVNGGKLRLRGSLDLTSHWTLEGDYSFGRNNFRVDELGATPQQRDFGVRLHGINFNLVRFWTSSNSRFRPYLTTGLGLSRFSPTDVAKTLAINNALFDAPASLATSNTFGFPLGGGAEIRLSRWFGTRLEVKDYISAVPRFGVSKTSSGAGGTFFPVTGIAHNVEAAVGIVFYLTPRK